MLVFQGRLRQVLVSKTLLTSRILVLLLLRVLFAGLDARAAAIVMSAVRNVASSGRTVMVTIHQPSIEIFEAFDTLLLLQVRAGPGFGAGQGGRQPGLPGLTQTAAWPVLRLPCVCCKKSYRQHRSSIW